MLFERVNKSGMTLPWERVLSRQSEQARSNLKVAAIGQTFALLSGEPFHRMIGSSFHGGMIAVSTHRWTENSGLIFLDLERPTFEIV